MFASSLELIGAWRASRFPWPRYLPLAAFLAWAGWAGGAFAPVAFLGAWALAASLLAQFRLWDDLVDRARDRAAHPQRVLVRAPRAGPFVRCTWLLGAANAIGLAWSGGAGALAGYLLLCVAAALWYRLHAGRGLPHVAMLHLKYPALVVLVAPPGAVPVAGACLAYGALVGFELLDTRDRVRRGLRHLPLALAALALTFVTLGDMP